MMTRLAVALLAGVLGAAEQAPGEPASLPILYDQPGDRFILRVDNRRYQLRKELRGAVADLMADANRPRAKLAHEELVTALAELGRALERAESARREAERDAARSRRAADTLEAVSRQLAVLRTTQPVDVNALSALLGQVAAENETLRRARQQEDRSLGRAEAADRAAEPARRRTEKAREDYARALADYERPLSKIRAIAMTEGDPL